MANETRNITVKVGGKAARDLRAIASQMGNLNQTTKRVSKTARDLSFAFRGFIGIQTIKSIARASDEFQLIRDRIKVFSDSTQDADKRFRELVQAAEFTKASVSGLGDVYARLALGTEDLNLSSKSLIDITTALQQSFRISGASLEEARAASIQFAQGLSSGALRGDELRSVTEQNARLTQLLAEKFGVASGRLKDLGKSGKLTSDVLVSVLLKELPRLNKEAENLGVTFGQALTIATDKLKLKLSDLSKELDISGKLAKGLNLLTENIDEISNVLISLVGSGALLKFAEFLTTLQGASILKTAGALGTMGVALGSVATALYVVKKAYDESAPAFQKNQDFDSLIEKVKEYDDKLKDLGDRLKAAKAEQAANKDSFFGSILPNARVARLEKDISSAKELRAGYASALDQLKELERLTSRIEKKPKAKKDAIIEIDKNLLGLKKLESQLKLNIITQEQFNKQVAQQELKKLDQDLKQGLIPSIDIYIQKYEVLLKKINKTPTVAQSAQKALQDYGKAATNLGQNIATAITNTLGNLENVLVDFVRKGKLEFQSLVDAILDDLARIAIRQSITGPLAQGIASAFAPQPAGAATNAGTIPSAKGNVFSNGNITPFASGGVVNSPTYFPLNNGRTGLMGEAGAEGILPLTRVNGDLGVKAAGNVIVNIQNNSGSEVTTQETTGANGDRELTVIVGNAVNAGIASGRFDKSLGESFGLSRRGR